MVRLSGARHRSPCNGVRLPHRLHSGWRAQDRSQGPDSTSASSPESVAAFSCLQRYCVHDLSYPDVAISFNHIFDPLMLQPRFCEAIEYLTANKKQIQLFTCSSIKANLASLRLPGNKKTLELYLVRRVVIEDPFVYFLKAMLCWRRAVGKAVPEGSHVVQLSSTLYLPGTMRCGIIFTDLDCQMHTTICPSESEK